MNIKYFVGENKEEQIVRSSSSGGAFSAIAKAWFTEKEKKNAWACGCVLTERLEAHHILVNSFDECKPMRGSKYIASEMSGIIQTIGNLLKQGQSVLFSGTPCQVAGLQNYLTRHYIDDSNLLTIEVICHGTAKKEFFKDYISDLEHRYKGKATTCNFRSKRRKGSIESIQVQFDNHKTYNASSTRYDWFYSLYIRNYVLQDGCYTCKYAKPERNADISIGDAWGRKENLGKSLILINSEKGLGILSLLHDYMILKEIKPEETNQQALIHPPHKPDNYEKFWSVYKNEGYLAAQRFIGNNTIKKKATNKLVYIANELGVKQAVKAVINGFRSIFS